MRNEPQNYQETKNSNRIDEGDVKEEEDKYQEDEE